MTREEIRTEMMIMCQQFYDDAIKEARTRHNPDCTPEEMAAMLTEMTLYWCFHQWAKSLPFEYVSILNSDEE